MIVVVFEKITKILNKTFQIDSKLNNFFFFRKKTYLFFSMKLITEIGSYKICVSVEIVAKLTNLWTKNNCKKIVNPMEGLVKEFITFRKTK